MLSSNRGLLGRIHSHHLQGLQPSVRLSDRCRQRHVRIQPLNHHQLHKEASAPGSRGCSDAHLQGCLAPGPRCPRRPLAGLGWAGHPAACPRRPSLGALCETSAGQATGPAASTTHQCFVVHGRALQAERWRVQNTPTPITIPHLCAAGR